MVANSRTVVAPADLDVGLFVFELDGLGRRTDGGELVHVAVRADIHKRLDDGMGADTGPGTDGDVGVDDGVGTHRDIGGDFRFGVHDCGGMNHGASPIMAIISASATTFSSTVALPPILTARPFFLRNCRLKKMRSPGTTGLRNLTLSMDMK